MSDEQSNILLLQEKFRPLWFSITLYLNLVLKNASHTNFEKYVNIFSNCVFNTLLLNSVSEVQIFH